MTRSCHPARASRLESASTASARSVSVRRVDSRTAPADRQTEPMTSISEQLRLPAGPGRPGRPRPERPPRLRRRQGATARPRWPQSATPPPICRSGCSPSRGPAATAACCWCSRAWTPRARAASCGTAWGCSTRKASRSRPSRRRPKTSSPHDFLWRIEQRVPAPGMVGIFDRSHYEDVLIVRVRELASADEIERRYGAINDFEQRLVDAGTTVIKCFLHISRGEAGRATAGAARRPDQALEVQPRRHRRAAEVGRLPARLRDRSRALQHRRTRPGT